jgi:hypothetical protein
LIEAATRPSMPARLPPAGVFFAASRFEKRASRGRELFHTSHKFIAKLFTMGLLRRLIREARKIVWEWDKKVFFIFVATVTD